MPDSVNYPDILGMITGGDRSNIGAAQVAVAARPRIVRAGRPFEVILLVQNCVESAIDVMMAVHLPGADAKRQRERFIMKEQRLVVTVKGAEVGCVVLPVTTLPDTAISDGYRIGVEVEVKPLGKSSRIRQNGGGGKVEPERLTDDARARIDELKTLSYTTSKHFGRNLFDVPVTVMSGTLGKIADFTPGWVSVCKVSDYQDNRLLLHRFGPLVQVNTLPKLKRSLLFKPLMETTKERFAAAGYPLVDGEATAIAKLMTLVLEYATPRFNAHGNIAARGYDVEALLQRDPFTFETPPAFPHWFSTFITTLERDERAATYPAQVIPRYIYEDLLRDAVDFGFDLVTEGTGEDPGSAEERETYREQLIALLSEKRDLDFSRVYLPLVIGAVLINDQLTLEHEDPAALLHAVGTALKQRADEMGEAEQPLYEMIHSVIARTGQRYGSYLGE
ncbi:MAG: hypothetical protein IT319_12575 [Anaerolineae bacterium]|nr:hypothetical protein [Anaerolineae bacterium]